MMRFLVAAAMGLLGFTAYREAEKAYGPFQVFGPPTQASIDAAALAQAKNELVLHEGRRNDAYLDSKGILTVGIGHKVLPEDNLRLGDRISDEMVERLFAQDTAKAFAAAKEQALELGKYDAGLIAALTSVNFQLGTAWRGKFTNTWNDLKRGNVAGAISRLQQSEWMKQTPVRVAAFIDSLQGAFS